MIFYTVWAKQNNSVRIQWLIFCWWENEGMTKWSLRWWSGRLSGWEFFKVEIMSCLLDFGLGQKFWIPLFHVKSIHLGSSSSWRVKKQSEPCLLLTFTSTSRPKTCQTQNFVASPFKDIFFYLIRKSPPTKILTFVQGLRASIGQGY